MKSYKNKDAANFIIKKNRKNFNENYYKQTHLNKEKKYQKKQNTNIPKKASVSKKKFQKAKIKTKKGRKVVFWDFLAAFFLFLIIYAISKPVLKKIIGLFF